jgi:hypothetical protein
MGDLGGLMGNMSIMIGLMVAVPFIVIAAVLLFIGLRANRKAGVSKYWTETMGQVVSSGIEPRTGRSQHGYTTAYYPVVVYTYDAMGQRFQSSRINFGAEMGYGYTGWAQNIVNKFPVGSAVPVYFNPENPPEAVLTRSAGGSSKILIFVALMMLVCVAISLAFSFLIGQIKLPIPGFNG